MYVYKYAVAHRFPQVRASKPHSITRYNSQCINPGRLVNTPSQHEVYVYKYVITYYKANFYAYITNNKEAC